MDAGDAGDAAGDRLVGSKHRPSYDVQFVTDQRGKEPRCAEPGMRSGDRFDGLHLGPVIEQDAVAAVHLDIDETGQQIAAAEVVDLLAIRRNSILAGDALDRGV